MRTGESTLGSFVSQGICMIVGMTDRAHMLELAEANHGLIARHMLTGGNVDRQRWKRMVRSTEWEQLTSRVLRVVGSAQSAEQRLAAAVLDAGRGSALYGVSAAAHWKLAGFVLSDRSPIHVVRPVRERRCESQLAVVHTTVRQDDRSTRRLRSIDVTSPTQTILDLARDVSAPRLEAAIDRAVSKRIVAASELHDAIEVVARSGRDGISKLREAMASRPPGYVPPESNVETRFQFLMRGAGFNSFRRQVDVGDSSWIGRVDFFHRHLPLVIEVNSEEYHAALVDQIADGVRYERLEEAGLTMLPIWDTDVWYRADQVVRTVAGTIAALKKVAA